MDTGNIMENQMQQQYEASEILLHQIHEESIELYKKHKLTPKEIYNKGYKDGYGDACIKKPMRKDLGTY